MSDRPLLILNPASAGGRTGQRRAAILDRVRDRLGELDVVVTSEAGDARRRAFEAAEAGRETILVGGGDGTLSEVAWGVIEATQRAPGSRAPRIGLLPLGSGGDLARTLRLPRSLDEALEVVRAGHTRRIDAGRFIEVEPAPDAEAFARCFVNEVGAGLSAATIRRVGRWAKRVGARLGFAAGAVASILTHRPVALSIEVDGELVHEGPVSLVVVANGRYFGAGMQVAPGADLADGRLEVVVVRGLAASRLLVNLPSLFAGTHGAHPSVSFHPAQRVRIAPAPEAGVAPAPEALELDVDGEAVGRLPIRVEVLPEALEVFVPVESADPAASPRRVSGGSAA